MVRYVVAERPVLTDGIAEAYSAVGCLLLRLSGERQSENPCAMF